MEKGGSYGRDLKKDLVSISKDSEDYYPSTQGLPW
jgi:hypothetical protein